jgi:hypothetical protein
LGVMVMVRMARAYFAIVLGELGNGHSLLII